MLPPPDRRGADANAFEASGGAEARCAPAGPPEEPADAGLENRRVTAFVIMRSGGASSGAAGAAAGAGAALGAEPNSETRENQPGPEDFLGAGRPANWMTRSTSATIAASAAAACMRLCSSTTEG